MDWNFYMKAFSSYFSRKKYIENLMPCSHYSQLLLVSVLCYQHAGIFSLLLVSFSFKCLLWLTISDENIFFLPFRYLEKRFSFPPMTEIVRHIMIILFFGFLSYPRHFHRVIEPWWFYLLISIDQMQKREPVDTN